MSKYIEEIVKEFDELHKNRTTPVSRKEYHNFLETALKEQEERFIEKIENYAKHLKEFEVEDVGKGIEF